MMAKIRSFDPRDSYVSGFEGNNEFRDTCIAVFDIKVDEVYIQADTLLSFLEDSTYSESYSYHRT